MPYMDRTTTSPNKMYPWCSRNERTEWKLKGRNIFLTTNIRYPNQGPYIIPFYPSTPPPHHTPPVTHSPGNSEEFTNGNGILGVTIYSIRLLKYLLKKHWPLLSPIITRLTRPPHLFSRLRINHSPSSQLWVLRKSAHLLTSQNFTTYPTIPTRLSRILLCPGERTFI